MANGLGNATMNFGAAPGTNITSVAVTGQATISGTSVPEAFWHADDTTADHTAYEHRHIAPQTIKLTCGTLVAGTGFTIYATSTERLTGQFKCRWVWSD